MSDEIVINITPDPSINISAVDSNEAIALNPLTLNQGLINHSVTHQSGGSDELAHNLLGGLQGGSGNQFYHLTSGEYSNLTTGAVVRPSETGQFYPSNNPSGYTATGYVTGISGYLQNQISLSNISYIIGDFDTLNLTAGRNVFHNINSWLISPFFPATKRINLPSSNSFSGDKLYLNLTSPTNITTTIYKPAPGPGYVLAYTIPPNTNFIGSWHLTKFVGSLPIWEEFSSLYGFLSSYDAKNIYVNRTENQTITGIKNFVSRPTVNSTGVILSGEATTQTYVTGISGGLQTQITTLNNQTGSFYLNSNPSGYITGVDLSFSGNYYTKDESESRYVNTTGAETILGDKTFHDKVYINNLYVTGTETIVNTTNANVASNYLMLNLTGGAVDGGLFFVTGSGLTGINDSGAIIGFDHADKFKFGIGTRASDLSTLNTIVAYEQVTGISGGLQSQITNLNSATGSYVLNNQTGIFYTNDNPSGFITGVDLSNYVLNSETGNFITNFETGQFYSNSNPSGFITGVDLSSYATQDYVTGISGDLQSQITNLNNSTGSYVLNTETGNFITTFETGQFYAESNPSGFITGVDLSSYATQTYVTGVSGNLQNQITTINNQTGSFYPRNNPSGYITGLSNVVYTITNQTINGTKNFTTRPTVNNVGVLLTSETGAFGGDLSDVVFTTGNQTISGTKNFNTRPTVKTTGVVLVSETGQFYPTTNPSGYITEVQNVVYTTGAQTINSHKTFTTGQTIVTPTNHLILKGNSTGNSIFLTTPVTITANRTYTIPDIGASTAAFVLTQGPQNINGNKAFLNNLTVSGSNLIVGTGHTILSSVKNSIIGGEFNTLRSSNSFIGGGTFNFINSGSLYSNIIGGEFNQISINSQNATVIGGESNSITSNSPLSIILGGSSNSIRTTSSFIGAGNSHNILSGSYNSYIGGGNINTISTGSFQSIIGGGNSNSILQSAYESTIVGGKSNSINSGSYQSFIGGGNSNFIFNNANGSVIVGGDSNKIQSGAYQSSILGGRRAIISSGHSGALVLADAQSRDHYSKGPNTCSLDFINGVYLRLPSFTGSKNQSGNFGELKVSGEYLYIATGQDTWGRIQISTF